MQRYTEIVRDIASILSLSPSTHNEADALYDTAKYIEFLEAKNAELTSKNSILTASMNNMKGKLRGAKLQERIRELSRQT